MSKTILVTGSTDGIGLETAKALHEQGHTVLLHGRSAQKLAAAREAVTATAGGGEVDVYQADFSRLGDVARLADEVAAKHAKVDVLINNAGILRTANEVTEDGLDIRFVVNLLAPVLLTRRLLPLTNASSRVVNLSSAAQAPVNLQALAGKVRLSAMDAYAQSKLALTMWSRHLARQLGSDGPVIVAVNPGSLLASKMVKEGFGVAGNDLSIGVDILLRAALADEFASASGQYFDNDSGRFSNPHPDGMNDRKADELMDAVDAMVEV
ncbi:SDR family NAD(P)-dependent oxidoreductase [Roseibium sp. MMSF_3412]|uniref:SDR family NAD(P)-dependent oxidoreductase n=1 Tax=Roseibium sp. MMSF_3412 TaxID=3046712 RepID=UPI00273FB946|nr:SDR family NAD(P)-dependent oxidoreductase [Roseibium sp. MMSF_3412]